MFSLRKATLLLGAVLPVLTAGCGSATATTYTATVIDTTYTINSPAIGTVHVLTAPLEGTRVSAGDTLMQLDTAELQIALDKAKADAELAKAQIDIVTDKQIDLEDKSDEVTDKSAELATKEKDLKKAVKKLQQAQKQLRKNANTLNATRQDLQTKLKQAEAAKAKIPTLPPNAPPQLQQQIAQGLAKAQVAIAQIKAGLAKLDQAQSKIAAGKKKLAKGMSTAKKARPKITDAKKKLRDAKSDIAEGRTKLKDLKNLTQILADSYEIGIEIAENQLALAAITSPFPGTVISSTQSGQYLNPAAPLAVIRPEIPSEIQMWVPDLNGLCAGMSVGIRGDWMNAAVPGTISTLGTQFVYPPSSTATDAVHMTRAYEVRIISSEQIPAGLPLDVIVPKAGCNA